MTDIALEPLPKEVPQWPVWRYLRLDSLLTAIQTKRLSLTLLRNYLKDDPFETSVPKGVDDSDSQITNQQEWGFGGEERGTAQDDVGNSSAERYAALKKKRRALLRSAHASCWRWGGESEAMWRLYCQANDGVAICSTFERLKNSIRDDNTVISCIAYIDYKTDLFVRHHYAYDPALHKRKAFEHEQEIRVLRFSTEDFERAGGDESYNAPEFISLDWDPETLVDRIVMNPRSSEGFLKEVTDAVGRLSAPLAKKVQRSELAAPPGW